MNEDEYKAKFPLHYGVIVGDAESVESLLVSKCVNVNQKDNIGNAPLHYAVCNQSGKDKNGLIVECLLLAGANINEQENSNGNTAMHCAIKTDNLIPVGLLLKRGANTLLENNCGETAEELLEQKINEQEQRNTNTLFISFMSRDFTHKKIDELIERGADINGTLKNHHVHITDNNGKSVLTYLVGRYSEQKGANCPSAYNVLCMITKAIVHGADPHKQDDHGNSAMSLIQGMGQGKYQTNLIGAIQNGFNKMQSNNHSDTQPDTSIDVSHVKQQFEQPSTLRDNSGR